MTRFILSFFSLILCFPVSAQRVITAGSALTETVCALGDCSKIISSDRTSLYPAEIQKLPSIGYRSSISAEGIISLQPTLVIAEKDYVDATVLSQIQSAGVKLLIIERVYTVDGTKEMIRQISQALQKKQEGEKLIARLEADLAEAQALVKKSRVTPRVLCVFNRDKSSLSIAGANTFSSILPYVGAVPAVTGVDGYKPLNTEALMASQADYLLMFESGVQALGGIDGVLTIPGVAQTPAGKKKQVLVMDGIKLSNFGPRFGEAVKELARQLHPDSKL